MSYVPTAMADRSRGRVLLNPYGQNAGPAFNRFTAAHELGHLGEPQFVKNRVGADTYQQAAMGYLGRPWLTRSVAGRGENRLQVQGRDPWGLPTEGPGTLHSSPVEQYANDAAQAMGITPWKQGGWVDRHHWARNKKKHLSGQDSTNYNLAQAGPSVIARLQKVGVLPKPKSKYKKR